LGSWLGLAEDLMKKFSEEFWVGFLEITPPLKLKLKATPTEGSVPIL